MSTPHIVELLAIGLLAGSLGGLLGIGGSLIMIPALTEVLGPDQHLYQSSAMIVNFFVVVPAIIQHHRARAIDARTVLRLAPIAALSVVAGVWLSERPAFSREGDAYLRGMFGLFLLSVCGLQLARAARQSLGPSPGGPTNPGGASAGPIRLRTAAIVAIPIGLIAGLLGVGGGVLAVPLQQRFLRVPLQRAIANSAAVILATSVIGAVGKNLAYLAEHGTLRDSLIIAAALTPTAIVGSFLGSRATHRLPLRHLRSILFVILCVAAIRLLGGAIGSLRAPAAKPGAAAVARVHFAAAEASPAGGEGIGVNFSQRVHR